MKRAIQIFISIILLVILIYWIDFKQIQVSLTEARYLYLVAALIIITLDRILMGLKWKILLEVKKINISLLHATKIYYMSNFLGLFLPPTIGTDLVRAYCVSKNGGKMKMHDIFASIVIERYLGFLGIFITGLLGCIYMFHFVSIESIDLYTISVVVSILTLFISVGFFISMNKKIIRMIKSILCKFRHNKILKKILIKVNGFLDSYAHYSNHKTVLTISILLTFFEIFLVVLWTYAIALGLNISVSLLYFMAFVPINLILVRLPISLDGFGINEASYVYFLAAIGISEALSFSLGIINHFITIIAIIPGGIFWAVFKNENEIERLELSKIQNEFAE